MMDFIISRVLELHAFNLCFIKIAEKLQNFRASLFSGTMGRQKGGKGGKRVPISFSSRKSARFFEDY